MKFHQSLLKYADKERVTTAIKYNVNRQYIVGDTKEDKFYQHTAIDEYLRFR